MGKREFSCPIYGCPMSFSTQQQLDTHTYLPHFPCERCGKRFVAGGLVRHKDHANRNPLTCIDINKETVGSLVGF